MSDYNLNDPNAFAALTSAFGSALGGGGGLNPWNIAQSSYKNVPFHIFTSAQATNGSENYSAAVPMVHDRTGRRKVLYQFPFQDGQTTGDLGRAPFVFQFDVVFFGDNYFVGYQAFYNVLNEAEPGVLRHPVLGDIECVATDWEVTHQYSERLALTMRVTFQEHTYDPGLVFSNVPALGVASSASKPSTFKGAIIAAMNVFQTVDAAVTSIRAEKAYATSLINGSVNLINTLKSNVLLTLQSLYLSFSPVSVALSPDLPGVLPVNLGGQALPSGGQASALYPMTDSSSTPFSTKSTPSVPNATSPSAPNPNLTPTQAQSAVNKVLDEIEVIVGLLNSATPQTISTATANGQEVIQGQGAVDFYPQVLLFKQIGQQLVTACLLGIASSKQVTTTYTVPVTLQAMSIREVAFAIGLDVNFSDQIRQMNPGLLSVNLIPGGTVLNVPLSA